MERRDLDGGDGRKVNTPRRRRRQHGQRAGRRRDLVRLIRQDDRMPMMIGGHELDEVSLIRPVTVGRQSSAQRSEDKQQEA